MTARTGGDRCLGAATVAIGLGWIVVIGYVVLGQLPSPALELPGQRVVARHSQAIAPQGWAFFTKSARDPVEAAWQRDSGGTWRPASSGPHAGHNLFGLDRASRAQAADLGVLVAAVHAARWAVCDDGLVDACLARAGAAYPVTNPAPAPLLCGEIGITRREPVPWAWADAADRTRMPVTAVRLEVAC
ncbi:SdpA family antimicrobial peptide system protein [Herbidospora galbida]|uniref:SdpA family antimicrobial peptide system protein n=1 Tax=Herbidospora galbida TaxID=2575442 RepID=A0A4U3MGV9_9ACTN|nr:SdpA family antimicrobial peptide system protein [Herbidospora galbida]TKK87197.1 SdpA family antimicrobial peptide system protein [Herbidospora galbida]